MAKARSERRSTDRVQVLRTLVVQESNGRDESGRMFRRRCLFSSRQSIIDALTTNAHELTRIFYQRRLFVFIGVYSWLIFARYEQRQFARSTDTLRRSRERTRCRQRGNVSARPAGRIYFVRPQHRKRTAIAQIDR